MKGISNKGFLGHTFWRLPRLPTLPSTFQRNLLAVYYLVLVFFVSQSYTRPKIKNYLSGKHEIAG